MSLENMEPKEYGSYDFRQDWELFFEWERKDFENLIEIAEKYGKYSDYSYSDPAYKPRKYLDWFDKTDGGKLDQGHNSYYTPKVEDFYRADWEYTRKLWTKSVRDYSYKRQSKELGGYTPKQVKLYSGKLNKMKLIEHECASAFISIRTCESIFNNVIDPILKVGEEYRDLMKQTERTEEAKRKSNAVYDLINSGYELHEITHKAVNELVKASE